MERALSSLGLKSVRSTKDMQNMPTKNYPTSASDYELLEDCGRGVSATVHRALCKPLNEVVAIKKMNLESMNCNLEEIIHEAQLMKKYHHPNILPLYCSFVHGEDLWMVMPFIAGGSVLHIMKYAHPEGLDEPVIATIMREVLKGLEYVHKHGGIHRDVKAGNILVDSDGVVKVADFGVSATIERGASWGNDIRARMTFVGTPCWMAPEVMEQTMGYDQLADIWSVGITLLELAHGHAPFAKYPPMKILMMTLSNPPPTLEDKGGKKHFSKSMRDVVTKCLQKDPSKRPTATQLLEHKFFKQARDSAYLKEHLMATMTAPLVERVEKIRAGKAATTPEENDRNMEASQEQYVRGVSSWNFDIGALKQAAANEPDHAPAPSRLSTIPSSSSLSPLSPPPTPSLASALTAGMTPSASSDSLQAAPTVAAAGGPPAALPSPTPASAPQLPIWSHASSASTALSAFAVPAAAEAAATAAAGGLAPPGSQALRGELRPSLSDSITSGSGRRTQDSLPESVVAPLSPPGAVSPLTASREPSLQGSAPAPGSAAKVDPSHKQRKGRFQVYEANEEPPPFSPPQNSVTDAAPAGGTLATVSAPPAAGSLQPSLSQARSERTSEDGSKSIDGAPERSVEAAGAPHSKPPNEAGSHVEKKKGRFRVIEEEGPRRIASTASLTDASKRAEAAAKAAGASLGPWRAYLQDLVDQSAAHTASLQKLLAAAAESELTGKAPGAPLTRLPPPTGAPKPPGPAAAPPEAAVAAAAAAAAATAGEQQLEAAQARAAEAEKRAAGAEEAAGKLRARVEQLEEENRRLAAALEVASAAAHEEAAALESAGVADGSLQRTGSGGSQASSGSQASESRKGGAVAKVLRRLSHSGTAGSLAASQVPAMRTPIL